MYIPPIQSSNSQIGDDPNLRQAVQDISQIHDCMVLDPPDQGRYETLKADLNTLLPQLQAPFKQFIQHGILYQCDAFFNPGNPFYSCNTNSDVQQGISVALTTAFSSIGVTPSPFPVLTASQISTLQADLATFMTDLKAGNQTGCAADANTLNTLANSLSSPYADIISQMTSQYQGCFSPPDHNQNYYVGMMNGFNNSLQYLTAPNYDDGSILGDFMESEKVYGDDASAATDAMNPNIAGNQGVSEFVTFYDLFSYDQPGQGWTLATPPDVNATTSPDALDWLHDLTVFLNVNNGVNSIPPSVFNSLSQGDQDIINGFLNGTGPFLQSGSGENMKSNWLNQDGYGKAGCDYYATFVSNGTFAQLETAAKNLLTAYIKTQ